MALVGIGNGCSQPNAMAGAIGVDPRYAGTAAGVSIRALFWDNDGVLVDTGSSGLRLLASAVQLTLPGLQQRFAFGDSPAMADRLLEFVLAGAKTATCWSVRDGQQTHVGKRMVVNDGAGRPRAGTTW